MKIEFLIYRPTPEYLDSHSDAQIVRDDRNNTDIIDPGMYVCIRDWRSPGEMLPAGAIVTRVGDMSLHMRTFPDGTDLGTVAEQNLA